MHIMQSALAVTLLFVLALAAQSQANETADWTEQLSREIRCIDQAMPGRFGVYVRHLGDGRSVRHRADRDWYLASTIKIPLAVALMQKIEAGELSADQELELADTDYVDGAGELLWRDPGERFTLEELNRRSIRDSDSVATDMLVRLLGEEALDQQVREAMVPEGFGPITTILQVRYDAYGEIHPAVAKLSNRDFIELRAAGDPEDRYGLLLTKLGIGPEEAAVGSTAEAFEQYYSRGINSGSLEAFGVLLERLVRGELLNDDHTRLLLEYMESVNTGDRRIKAGLPDGARFAHKTGTQIARSCNVGIINPHREQDAVIVLACAEDYQQLAQAEAAYQVLGRALDQAGLVRPD